MAENSPDVDLNILLSTSPIPESVFATAEGKIGDDTDEVSSAIREAIAAARTGTVFRPSKNKTIVGRQVKGELWIGCELQTFGNASYYTWLIVEEGAPSKIKYLEDDTPGTPVRRSINTSF